MPVGRFTLCYCDMQVWCCWLNFPCAWGLFCLSWSCADIHDIWSTNHILGDHKVKACMYLHMLFPHKCWNYVIYHLLSVPNVYNINKSLRLQNMGVLNAITIIICIFIYAYNIHTDLTWADEMIFSFMILNFIIQLYY